MEQFYDAPDSYAERRTLTAGYGTGFFVFILYGKLDWVTQENSTYLGNQNPSRSPKTINLLLKSHVSQLRKHCTEVLSVFVCAK
jgi:hypothetical protein